MASALLAPSAYAQREPQKFIQIADDFSRDSANWLAAFTDYNLINSVPHRIAEIRTLPPYIDASRRAFYLQAVNDSDDLFSFLKKPITPDDGIEPNAIYEVSFLVEFASNASTECAGLGGAPGLDVYLKVGASATEPVATLVGEKLTFNLDKGNQAEGGRDATVAGHIGVINDECDPEKARFVLAERRQKHTQRVRASSFGWLWLFVGADSGYEGLNQLYYSRIVVTLTRVEGGAR
ncbi:MAG TPA: hypothetical protein VER03_10335 [Bryobacteraceae bacterium]|nr:hypothetical protein [Bryobacteraceae bacterium]